MRKRNNAPTDFANMMTKFLSQYLPGQRAISVNTIKSYRDTFTIFLRFYKDYKQMCIEKLTLSNFKRELVEEFITWLETKNGNAVATRNQRLSALHAFVQYLQVEDPTYIANWQSILAIETKKCPRPQVGYLSADELKEIFARPNLKSSIGRRDLVLLNTLYDTGARVAELIDLKASDVRVDEIPVVRLVGKGSKARTVPLMTKTAAILKKYMEEHHISDQLDHPLFFNSKHAKFTRPGVTYILQKYSDGRKITPHILRHSKAMHLLQADVNILYIRDFLGHVDVATTEIYARANTEMKRAALEKVYTDLTPVAVSTWDSDTDLMDWLHNLV